MEQNTPRGPLMSMLSILGGIGLLAALYLGRERVRSTLVRLSESPSHQSSQVPEQAPGQVWTHLQDLALRTATLESQFQLVRHEWEDSWSKMRAVEERIKKRQQRASRAEELEEEESPAAYWPPQPAPAEPDSNGTHEAPSSPDHLAAVKSAVFQQRFGRRLQ